MGRALTFPWRRTTGGPFPGNPQPPPAPPGPAECDDSGKPSERPLWPGGTCTALGSAARRGTPARTREPGAEAGRALGVAAAAAAVLAPVVPGGAGAAPRSRPVAGLHGHQGLACGRERRGGEAAGARADTHLPPRATRSPAPPAPNHPDPTDAAHG